MKNKLKSWFPTRIDFLNISRTGTQYMGAIELEELYKSRNLVVVVPIIDYNSLIDCLPKKENNKEDESDISKNDELFHEAVEFSIKKGKSSASMLQRQFRIGYNRASEIIKELENAGIIGPENGAKPREVLITEEQYIEFSKIDEHSTDKDNM